jgi:hypothetical protein
VQGQPCRICNSQEITCLYGVWSTPFRADETWGKWLERRFERPQLHRFELDRKFCSRATSRAPVRMTRPKPVAYNFLALNSPEPLYLVFRPRIKFITCKRLYSSSDPLHGCNEARLARHRHSTKAPQRPCKCLAQPATALVPQQQQQHRASWSRRFVGGH